MSTCSVADAKNGALQVDVDGLGVAAVDRGRTAMLLGPLGPNHHGLSPNFISE